jgi:hypothetical protein
VLQDASVLGASTKEYHVEKGGKVIVVKRPNVEKLPKQYGTQLK